MKIYRTPTSVFLTLYLPFFVLYTILYLFEYQQLLSLRTIHWLFLALALSLIISAQRNQHTPTEARALPWPLYLGAITGFVSLLCAYFYFCQLFLGKVLLINSHQTLTNPSFFNQLKNSGLFPWALVALFALTLQRTYNQEKGWGYFSHCLLPVFNSEILSEVGKYCNTTFRYPIIFSLATTLMSVGLAGLYLFSYFSDIPMLSGINLLTLFTSSILFYAITYSQWPQTINNLIKYRCPSLLSLLIMLIFGCAIFAAPTVLIQSLSDQKYLTVEYFNPAAWPLFYELASLFIVLTWVPLASATIAVISRGYAVWQIIGSTLLIPSLLMMSEKWEIPLENSTIAIALIICALALLILFFRPWVISHIWRGLFPTTMQPKQTTPVAYMQSLLVTSLTLIGIYWVADVYLITLILSAYTISATLMIMISVGYWTMR